MRWQVQISADKTQHCSLPPQLSQGVPFTAEIERAVSHQQDSLSGQPAASSRELEREPERGATRVDCVWQGRHLLLLRDIGGGLCLEENLTLLAQARSSLAHGRCEVQVLYATRAGQVQSCHAEVGLAAVAVSTPRADSMQANEVVSPLTGKIIKVLVTKDAEVQEGNALLIIEAMKMENVVQAEGRGVVAALNVKVGDAVRRGDVLLSLRREH